MFRNLPPSLREVLSVAFGACCLLALTAIGCNANSPNVVPVVVVALIGLTLATLALGLIALFLSLALRNFTRPDQPKE